jgi:hypothetical protein
VVLLMIRSHVLSQRVPAAHPYVRRVGHSLLECRNARFCLICNYVNKIIPALQSRCTRFRFPPLPREFVETRVGEICAEERVTVGSALTACWDCMRPL